MKRLSIQTMFVCLVMLFAMQGLSPYANAQAIHDINVLGRPEVREHLIADHGLSEENATAIRAITLGLVRNVGSLKRDLRVKKVNMSEEEVATADADFAEMIQTLNEENWANVTEILNEAQVARIKQLHIQFIGVDAYMDQDVAETIGLTEAQTTKIRTAMEAQQVKIAELKVAQREKVSKARANRRLMVELNKANQQELAEERIAFENSLKEILDEQQRETLAEMGGEAFEFSPIGR